MNEYETLYLCIPEASVDKLDALGNRLSELIKTQGGHVLTLFNWGKRRLAYRVEKHHNGVFIYLNYISPGSLVTEIERILKFDDQVLKFTTVKVEDQINSEERVKEKREFVLTSLEEPVERAPV